MAVEALLRQGHEVVSISPGSPGLDQKLQRMADTWGAALKHVRVEPYAPRPCKSALLEYYYVHCGWMRPRKGMSPKEIVKRLALGTFFKTEHWLRQTLKKRNIVILQHLFEDAATMPVEDVGNNLEKVQSLHGRPDFILLTYIDILQKAPYFWRKLDEHIQSPWGGISFVTPQAVKLRRHGAYSSKKCAGMAFLSAEVVALRKRNFPDKYFQLLPDSTNPELPKEGGKLAEALLKKAAGRKILLLIGGIQERKNLSGLAKMLANADASRVLFAVVGRFLTSQFSPETQAAVAAMEKAENVFLHDGYIQDEAELNACIAASDVIFAVYKNFWSSSNILTKAALYDKPTLVPAGGLMQKHVEEYGIGLAQDADDTDRMLKNFYLLLSQPPKKENYARFRADFSKEKWDAALGKFVSACLENFNR